MTALTPIVNRPADEIVAAPRWHAGAARCVGSGRVMTRMGQAYGIGCLDAQWAAFAERVNDGISLVFSPKWLASQAEALHRWRSAHDLVDGSPTGWVCACGATRPWVDE